MYKVLVIINVKMLEKSISVTVNSTVYQNITASTSWVDPIHVCVKEEKTALICFCCHVFSSKGIKKIEIHRLKKKKDTIS